METIDSSTELRATFTIDIVYNDCYRHYGDYRPINRAERHIHNYTDYY